MIAGVRANLDVATVHLYGAFSSYSSERPGIRFSGSPKQVGKWKPV